MNRFWDINESGNPSAADGEANKSGDVKQRHLVSWRSIIGANVDEQLVRQRFAIATQITCNRDDFPSLAAQQSNRRGADPPGAAAISLRFSGILSDR
jgi:hypothetical protein